MSVLMTAGKNAWRSSSAKRKKKSRRTPSRLDGSFDPTPPPSDETTVVWYWSLDGVPTTLMYNHHIHEVWCNGRILRTKPSSFPDPSASGTRQSAVDFTIGVEEAQSSVHNGRIVRLSPTDCATMTANSTAYCLYVDGVPIMEHSLNGARRAGQHLAQDDVMFGAHALPSYDEAVGQIPPYQSDDAGGECSNVCSKLGILRLGCGSACLHEKID